MTTILEDREMTIVIDGEEFEIDKVRDYGYLPMLECGRIEFYVAEDTESAGAKAEEYWREMAENDPSEFRCMVGDDNLIAWALGQWAGPGSESVQSLDDWFELTSQHPEEEFASYDGEERDVDAISQDLIDELGFIPTVAYRHN